MQKKVSFNLPPDPLKEFLEDIVPYTADMSNTSDESDNDITSPRKDSEKIQARIALLRRHKSGLFTNIQFWSSRGIVKWFCKTTRHSQHTFRVEYMPDAFIQTPNGMYLIVYMGKTALINLAYYVDMIGAKGGYLVSKNNRRVKYYSDDNLADYLWGCLHR